MGKSKAQKWEFFSLEPVIDLWLRGKSSKSGIGIRALWSNLLFLRPFVALGPWKALK